MITTVILAVLWTIVVGVVFLFLGACTQYSLFKKQIKAGLTPYISSEDNIEWKE